MRLTTLLAVVAWLPPADVPGALNPLVTQDTILQTICTHGWSTTQRPPLSYTAPIKRSLLPPGGHMADYELDHLVPLDLGGAPMDRRNLWLEPRGGQCGAAVKDRLEWELLRLVCSGQVTLDAAQELIARDWTLAYSRWVGVLPRCDEP